MGWIALGLGVAGAVAMSAAAYFGRRAKGRNNSPQSGIDLLRRYLESGDALALRTLQLESGPLSHVAAKLEHAEMQKAAFDWEVSQRRRISEELYRAIEAASNLSEYKSTFLANMSHELRTPLNGVLGMMRLLLDTELNERQREYAGVVQASAQTLLTVVNEILDFSKIEAGKMSIEFVPFDLRAGIEEVADLMAPQAAQKSIKLICDIDPRIGAQVVSDPVRVRQIVMNLLGNAIKFTHKGHVLLRLEALSGAPEGIRIVVEDTGIGIEAAARDQIFESFTQADGGTTRRYGGTGLGLTISRRLADLLGGSLGFKSEVGVGSRFWCEIPMSIASNVQVPTKGRILVAICQSEELEAMQNCLTAQGYETLCWDPNNLAGQAEFADWALIEPGAIASSQFADLNEKLGSKIVLLGNLSDSTGPSAVRSIERPFHFGKLRRVFGDLPVQCLAGMRILVVDDDRISLDLHARSLSSAGANVSTASSVQELEDFIHSRFELVLVDQHLEGENAVSIRKAWNSRFPDASWLAMSASFSDEQRTKCLEAGFEDCLKKPVLAESIAAICKAAVPCYCTAEATEQYLALLDPSRLERQFDGDRRAVSEVLAKFCESSLEILGQIEASAKLGDLGTIRRLAHRLAGMSRTVGCEALGDAASKIESQAEVGDSSLESLLDFGHATLSQVRSGIVSYLNAA